MKLVFFNNILNHHQVNVADEFFRILGSEYAYVVTVKSDRIDLKGGEDYGSRPYCILASDSEANRQRALALTRNADVCVFGAESLDYAIIRAKENPKGLSFELSERWLKKGWLNILSPRLRRWWVSYQLYFRKANFYKLNASAFAAGDHVRLHTYKNRQFKWGYFTNVQADFKILDGLSQDTKIRLMWCARFIKLKHPELPVKMAQVLRDKKYNFLLDFYGCGPEECNIKQLVKSYNLDDIVKFHGNLPNSKVLEAMGKHHIFLFTSNRLEGWGAVVNESMSNGCAVVASDCIGCVPYLVKDRYTGFKFRECDVSSLVEKVEWLLDHPAKLKEMQHNSVETMQRLWSPLNAAKSFLVLINDLQNGRECSVKNGPASIAEEIYN